MIMYVVLAALLPVIFLLWLIYRRDKYCPEPSKELTKAFFLGVLSIFVSLCISLPLGFLGLVPSESNTLMGAFQLAFFGAAIPEELAKYLMLWFMLKKSKYFDEAIDGIVYAVFVSLGFAALENIMYLFTNLDSWLSVGIIRAIFSVPAHYAFGVLMGYYYAQYKFSVNPKPGMFWLVLGVPILCHGLFDFILMSIGIFPPIITLAGLVIFIVFCFKMHSFAQKRITEQVQRDKLWKSLSDMSKRSDTF